ncbi:hypothetical protein [Acinetobacter higginsii]|uniref:hypothetical protein n=1 Tax=Acinetobacter higginsii TaxID=70347 RepID=UPI003008DD9D
MHTLLSVQLAFEAKQAGKNVVCRHIDADEFQSLKDVSANTWFDPDFVFALQIDTITLGGYEFTRPYSLDELILNDDVYYVGASGTILKGKFNPENEMLVSAVKNGSVQRDEENAVYQLNAFRSLLNVDAELPQIIDYDFFVVDGEPKKRGGRKKKESKPETSEPDTKDNKESPSSIDDDSEGIDLTGPAVKKYIDAIAAARNNAELVKVEDSIIDDNHKYAHEEINLFRELINQKRQVFKKIKAETELNAFKDNFNDTNTVEDLDALAIKIESLGDKHPDLDEDYYVLLVDIASKREALNQLSLIDQTETSAAPSPVDAEIIESAADNPTVASIREASEQAKGEYMLSLTEAQEAKAVNRLKESIDKDRRLIFTHKSHLDAYVEIRLQDIAKKESGALQIGKPDHHQVIADKIHNALNLVELGQIEDTLTESDKSHHFLNLAKARDSLTAYENCLNNLINQVQQAITIDEANEPASKTLGWSDAQRLPLLTAISKRLVELDVSLLTQIRTAPSNAILSCLLSEVKAMGTGTYAHNCMEAYRERKAALNPTSPA